jgi:spermidine/putrescine transport system ATP-binding protein
MSLCVAPRVTDLKPSSADLKRVPVLQVKNISKAFGDSPAVNKVSFDVYDGEFLFLIGPSGCGKTTTLRMIGGYELPTSGDIVIRGRAMNNVPLDKRNIGMVFQNYALFPHMTVLQNVEYGLRMRKVPTAERRERVNSVLELVHLTDYSNRYPVQLSGGQRQRVALARVIVFQPDILLLDEPLANLDKRLRDVMRVELKKLQEKVGITTVYVTHDQEEALTMADRIVVMQRGEILQIGTPSEVYNAPTTSFVSKFLGETSQFTGTVEGIEGNLAHLRMDAGFRMAVRKGADLTHGARVSVSVRPERICVVRDRPQQTENVFVGTVDFVSYYGSHVVYLICISGCKALVRASEPIPSGAPTFGVGDQVIAYWKTDHAVYVQE